MVWTVAILVILGIGYYFARMFYYLNNPSLTYRGGLGSKSIAESKDTKMFIGNYEAEKDLVKLKDGTVLTVKNAWMEHQFKYEEGLLFFIQSKKKTKGFYLVVPPLTGKPEVNHDTEELNYSLKLNSADQKFTSSPGFGLSEPLGYQVLLDEIPSKIRFDVVQKEKADDTWNEAKVVDTITYVKEF